MITNLLVQGEPVSWHFNNVYKMNNYNIITVPVSTKNH